MMFGDALWLSLVIAENNQKQVPETILSYDFEMLLVNLKTKNAGLTQEMSVPCYL